MTPKKERRKMKSTQSKVKAQLGWVYGKISLDGKEGWFDILSVPIEADKTLGALIFELIEFKKTHEDMIQRITHMKRDLQDHLLSHGYELSGDTFECLTNDIKRAKTLNPRLEHSVALLKDGYINGLLEISIDQVLENQQKPTDIYSGYYKVENGKIVLDKKRKERMLSLD